MGKITSIRKPRGERASKYTPDTVELICRLISNGLTYQQAADAAGIHRDTLNDWANTKSDFSDALKKAKALGVARRLERIEKAAEKGSWQADAWWLERNCPEQWGRKTNQFEPVDDRRDISASFQAALEKAYGEKPALPKKKSQPAKRSDLTI